MVSISSNGVRRLAGLLLLSCGVFISPQAEAAGEEVVVIYNTRLPESRQVAEYYAQQRAVPASQVCGFDLPAGEAMGRQEFVDQLQRPLLKLLEEKKLLVFGAAGAGRACVEAKIRYAALCYGVPTIIQPDPGLAEKETNSLPAELRRNEASVDSQLACLPLVYRPVPWAGPWKNPAYGATNTAFLHPTNGVLLVTRLDGPSAAIARGLVDKAMEAETNGMWGRAYIDLRGLTNGPYKPGDDLLRTAGMISQRMGYETIVDENPATFPASFPMSHIGIYAGWYDGAVSGPFTRPQVEFMPGAFAYHLHSFNASVLRTTTEAWVGPLLAKGATITLGTVAEPYLAFTPDIGAFCWRLIAMGFSFGEAACAAQNVLSWQTIAVGDPLYRPFGRRPDLLQADLEKRQSKWLEWSHLFLINNQLARGFKPGDYIAYLKQLPLTRTSPVLTEKLADLYWSQKKLLDSNDTLERVLKLEPSPQQKIRVLLTLAPRRSLLGYDPRAFELYQQFLKEFPDYPDLLSVYQKFLPVARRLGKTDEAARIEREIQRLTPPAPKP